MTSREYFVNVLNAHISEEMDTTSTLMIERLDAKNAKRKTRKSTESKDKRESRERRETVLAFLRENFGHIFTRDEVAEHLGISVGQVSAACKVLVANGLVSKSEVKSGKSRKVVYSAIGEDSSQYLDREVSV